MAYPLTGHIFKMDLSIRYSNQSLIVESKEMITGLSNGLSLILITCSKLRLQFIRIDTTIEQWLQAQLTQ